MSVLENIMVGIGVSLVAGGILALLIYYLSNYHKFRRLGVFLSSRTLREQFNEKKKKPTKITKKLSHLIKGWREKFVHFPEIEEPLIQALKSGENIRVIEEASRGKTRTIIECIRKLAREEKQFKHVQVVFITHNSSFEYKLPFRRLFVFKFPFLILFFDDIDKISSQTDKTSLTLSKIITDFKQVAIKVQLFCTCRSEAWFLAGKTKVDKRDLLEKREEIEHFFKEKVQLQTLDEREGRELAALYSDFDFPQKFSGNPGEIIFKTLTKRYEYDNLTEEYREVLQAIKLAILGGIYSPSITLIQKISQSIFSVEGNIGQILTDLHNSEFITVIHEGQVIDILDAYVDKVIHDFPISIKNRIQYLIILRKLLEEEEDAEKLFYLGRSFFALSDYEQTIETYSQTLKIEEKAVTYFNRGGAYAEQEKYEEAIKDCTKAIELEPEYTKAYSKRGYVYAKQKKYEEAIKDYTKTITIDSEYVTAYYNRGLIYTLLKKYEEAIKDFTKTIDLNPKNVKAYFNRGLANAKQEKFEEAISDYTRAIELDPEDAQIYNNRGTVYTRLEKLEEAIKDYTKAIELDPENAIFYYNRGLSYVKFSEIKNQLSDLSLAWKYRISLPYEGKTSITYVLSFLLKIYSVKKELSLSLNLATELKLWIKRTEEFFEEYSSEDREIIDRAKELLNNLEKE